MGPGIVKFWLLGTTLSSPLLFGGLLGPGIVKFWLLGTFQWGIRDTEVSCMGHVGTEGLTRVDGVYPGHRRPKHGHWWIRVDGT